MKKEAKVYTLWRPMLAYAYVLMCIFDYIVRPSVNFWHQKRFNLVETVEVIKDLNPTTQIQIIQSLQKPLMDPILNEFSHLALGSIITASAVTRGFEKVEQIRNKNNQVLERTTLHTRPKRKDEDENSDEDEDILPRGEK